MESCCCRACRVFVLFTVALLLLSSHLTRGQDTVDCPADGRTWLLFGENCYHFVHGDEDTTQSYSYESAQDKCRGFELLAVRSAQVNDYIVNYSPNVWKHNVNIWLGINYDSDDDVFRWNDDNSVLLYNNWTDGGSDETDLSLMNTCVVLESSTGKWENISCSEEPPGTGVVCQTKAVQISPPASSPFLSALVIISVILILVVSAVIWFLHQRSNPGSSILNLIEYNPPFRSPSADQTCLVEAEEVEEIP